MTLLKVTMKDGKPRWLVAHHIVHFAAESSDLTTIHFDSGTMIMVRDAPEHLASRLEELDE